MPDPVRVLATGSRNYPNVARVEEAITDVEAVYPGARLLLVHGRCDPRHPKTRTQIPWHVAEAYPPDRRLSLLGGDWLMAQVAGQHGWGIESHAPDWGRDNAELARNRLMVEMGARVAIVLTQPCQKTDCGIRWPHITHGSAHCAARAEAAGIKTWRYPA